MPGTPQPGLRIAPSCFWVFAVGGHVERGECSGATNPRVERSSHQGRLLMKFIARSQRIPCVSMEALNDGSQAQVVDEFKRCKKSTTPIPCD